MIRESKRKTITYKKATLGTLTGITLQELLEKRITNGGTLSKAITREMPLTSDDSGAFHLLNNPLKYQGMFFAELLLWEHGQSQQTIQIDQDAESFNIRHLKTEHIKADDDKEEEFVNSSMYFGVFKNHIVLLSSRALNYRQLESYLAWLFTTNTTDLKNHALILSDQPSPEARQKIESFPVKKVRIGAPVESVDIDSNDNNLSSNSFEKSVTSRLKFRPVGMSADVIATVLAALGQKVPKLVDSLDEANLQMKLEISYLGSTTTDSGQSFLDSVSTSLRHAHPDDVEVELKDGTKLKGSDLRLSHKVSVQTIDGLMVKTELYSAMHEWINDMIIKEII